MKRIIIASLLCVVCAIAWSTGDQEKGKTQAKTKITYWEKWTGLEEEFARGVIAAFNQKHPSIEVEYVASADLNKKAQTAIVAGDAPDVLGGWTYSLDQFAQKGMLRPLDDFIAKSRDFNLNDLHPAFREFTKVDGKVYGLFTTAQTFMMYWNKGLFTKAGLDPEVAPKSLEELDNIYGPKLFQKSGDQITQMAFHFYQPGISWFPWQHPLLFGSEVYDVSSRKYVYNDKVLKSFARINSWSNQYGPSSVIKFAAGFGDWGSAGDSFMSEKVALTLNGPWMAEHIQNFNPKMQYGCTVFPTAAGVEQIVIYSADTIYIPANSKHPQEAWEFIKFFNSKEGQQILNLGPTAAGRMSVAKDYGGEDFIKRSRNPYIRTHIEALDKYKPVWFPRSPALPEYNAEFSALIQTLVAQGDADVEKLLKQAMDRAQEKLDQQLSK